MLICKKCKKDWKVTGSQWKRHNNQKIDYWCNYCGNKQKPITIKLKNKFTKQLKKSNKLNHNKNPKNLLVIGDIHEPFAVKGYRDFCYAIYNKHRCSHTLFMGDCIDQHYASFHTTDPDGLGGQDELNFAIIQIQKWAKLFPIADVCLGNHDKIILRKAFEAGISKRWIKDFNDVLNVNWDFQPAHIINNVLFRHGLGMKAAPKAGSEMMSVVQGHFHTETYIQYRIGINKVIYGAQCPCGVDKKAYAMAYAKEHPSPALGCMVIKDYGRLPIIEMYY